ncbi:MAG TPA: protein translocase subunit SecF [Clostridiales bacterium]|nr:MAG: protein-export membrane protein SecF [Clostridiales bacterium GWD2_32_19]HCC07970.1 protein translocase subunit SecF [Clostridiales bacterium]
MKIMKIIENRMKFYTFSIVIILAGFIAMFTYKFINNDTMLNYDIDFTGGTIMKVNIGKEFIKEDIEKIVYGVTKSESVQVQKVQNENTVIIKYQIKEKVIKGNKVEAAALPESLVPDVNKQLPVVTPSVPVQDVQTTDVQPLNVDGTKAATPVTTSTSNETPAQTVPAVITDTPAQTESVTTYQNYIDEVIKGLSEKYDLTSKAFISTEDISPTISNEMFLNAISSVLIGTLLIMLYISFRFKDLKMGIASGLTLLHDVLIVLAVYAIFRIPINNAFIAAILTIIGYSINDTVIIFDRIRENKKLYKKLNLVELINSSITETFGRSINTSFTTVMVVAVLFVFGVESLREFTFPLMIGIIAGTYSSIGNSSPFWYDLVKNDEKNA